MKKFFLLLSSVFSPSSKMKKSLSHCCARIERVSFETHTNWNELGAFIRQHAHFGHMYVHFAWLRTHYKNASDYYDDDHILWQATISYWPWLSLAHECCCQPKSPRQSILADVHCGFSSSFFLCADFVSIWSDAAIAFHVIQNGIRIHKILSRQLWIFVGMISIFEIKFARCSHKLPQTFYVTIERFLS